VGDTMARVREESLGDHVRFGLALARRLGA